VTTDPYVTARMRMNRKQDELQGAGYSLGAASGAVEWARGVASEREPPERDPVRFLAELNRRIAQCENWARGCLDSLDRYGASGTRR
jgi:hypothetical protein